jgi:hypothetical protein
LKNDVVKVPAVSDAMGVERDTESFGFSFREEDGRAPVGPSVSPFSKYVEEGAGPAQ